MSGKVKWQLIGLYLAILIVIGGACASFAFIADAIEPGHLGIESVFIGLTFSSGIIGFIWLMVCLIAYIGPMADNEAGKYIFGWFYEKNSIIEHDDGRLAMLSQDEFYWNCDNPYKSCKVCEPLWSRTVAVTVYPLVGHKMVRRIQCRAGIQPPQDIAGLQKLQKISTLCNFYPEWEKTVQSMMYDFCEEFTGELAKLFNPLKQEQQETFSELLRSYLAPKLEPTGLELTNSEFNFS